MSQVGNIVVFFNPFSENSEEIGRGVVIDTTEGGRMVVSVDQESCESGVAKILGSTQVISVSNPHIQIEEVTSPGIQNIHELCKP